MDGLHAPNAGNPPQQRCTEERKPHKQQKKYLLIGTPSAVSMHIIAPAIEWLHAPIPPERSSLILVLGRWVLGRQSFRAARIRRKHIGRAFGIQQPRVLVDVRHIIALAMVVDVIGNARRATEHLRLFLGLDALRAREDAAAGDTDRNERVVVRSSVELGGDVWLLTILVVFLEEFLDLRAASGPVTLKVDPSPS